VKTKTNKKPAAQVAPARKAAELKATNAKKATRPVAVTPRIPPRAHSTPTMPERLGTTNLSQGPPLKFLSRDEVLKLVGVSYGTLWGWIREGKFPPARELNSSERASRIYWLEHEVLSWMANRPPRLPKGTRTIYNNSSVEA
jgi:predicted DNA-binding transcriptional regulator AlpA